MLMVVQPQQLPLLAKQKLVRKVVRVLGGAQCTVRAHITQTIQSLCLIEFNLVLENWILSTCVLTKLALVKHEKNEEKL